MENQKPARGYEGRYNCKNTGSASSLWPAHAAPLHMLLTPAVPDRPWAGQLLVAWHGHRVSGRRVMAFRLSDSGKLIDNGTEILGNWTFIKNVRPMGAPTGLTLDSKNRLFVLEDRNRTILMLGQSK
jgi:glucose/arabinose dehydrogenase